MNKINIYKLNINNFHLIKNIFFFSSFSYVDNYCSFKDLQWTGIFLQVYPSISNDFLSLVLQLSNVLIFIWDTHHNIY